MSLVSETGLSPAQSVDVIRGAARERLRTPAVQFVLPFAVCFLLNVLGGFLNARFGSVPFGALTFAVIDVAVMGSFVLIIARAWPGLFRAWREPGLRRRTPAVPLMSPTQARYFLGLGLVAGLLAPWVGSLPQTWWAVVANPAFCIVLFSVVHVWPVPAQYFWREPARPRPPQHPLGLA
jgi:membrane protein YdbS with pleckstrin-like domain